MSIKFGTDGWRGIIAEDFIFHNVRAVSQAIADFIKRSSGQREGIVIGYDNRFLSDRFATAVGEVMAGNSIPVFIPDSAVPTPVAAFAIRSLNARGAVMITASHNPPEYNGIKFIPEYAGPALPEVTSEIERNTNRILETASNIEMLNKEEAENNGLWQVIHPLRDYQKEIESLIDIPVIRKAGLNVVIDPLYGAGIGCLEKILGDMGCAIEAIHDFRDPLFGGSMPDPGEDNLVELKERVLSRGADLGFALDGDADRLGVIDRNGKFFCPNELLFLLLEHMLDTRGNGGCVARTVATTHMLDRIADKRGLEVKETPVGFKYIAQCLMHDGSIIGGEESGGICIRGHVPEKDGILTSVLITELVASKGKSLTQIQEKLFEKYGKMVSKRVDIRVTQRAKEEVLAKLENYNPRQIAGNKVNEKNMLDGTKFINDDGSWVLIRPSGTEPVFRIYIEANSDNQLLKIRDQVIRELEI